MKITENYIDISEKEIRTLLALAVAGCLITDTTQEDKQATLSFIRNIDDKCKVNYGELFEIRVVGDR